MCGPDGDRRRPEAPVTPAPEARRRWIIALSVTFGTMMGALDGAVINVAITHLRQAYGVTVEQATWLSTAYLIAAVLVMPLTGFLGRWYGQKRVYLASLALFVAASAGCAAAPSFTWLVVLRALQGLGAGSLQPTEHAILRQTFPAEQLGAAMGVFNLAVGLGPLAGPTLGGLLLDRLGWSWIFLVNAPIGLVGIALVSRFVPRDEPPARSARGPLDWPGIALLWVALIALQYVLEDGQRLGWFSAPRIAVLAVLAAASGIAFVRRELGCAAPAVRLRVFHEPSYAVGTVANAIAMAIVLSSAFLLPVFLQELLGYTAMASGMALLPRTLVMMIAMPIVGRLYPRLPPRAAVASGLVLTAIGQLLLARLDLGSTAADAALGLVLQGLGMSLVIIILSTLSLARVARPELGDAAGLSALLRQVGVSTGLAGLATALARWSPTAGAAEVRAATAAALAARATAFQHTFALGAALLLGLLPLVWFVRPPRSTELRASS